MEDKLQRVEENKQLSMQKKLEELKVHSEIVESRFHLMRDQHLRVDPNIIKRDLDKLTRSD